MPGFAATEISGSIFIGKVKIYRRKQYPSFAQTIDQALVSEELAKLKSGISQLESDIKVFLHDPEVSQLDKDILNTHLMIVTDIEITHIIEDAISEKLMSAPQAVLTSFDKIIRNFEQLDNSYFAQRADDYKDVEHRLMMIILGAKEKAETDFRTDDIVFLREITPSLVSIMARAGVKAYCTEHGSHTSHSAILTRSMGFTALVAKESILSGLRDGDDAILDAPGGLIIINPDAQQTAEYEQKLQEQKERAEYLKSQLELPAVTSNNIAITVKANIEYPGEISNVLDNRCEGIGLFRTEFIYLNRSTLPDEEEQTMVYTDLVSRLSDNLVIIRTFDLGGDKIAYLQQYDREENPYLGCRGIRFSLQQNTLFRTQVRAILRASVHGKTAVMFPMIISTEDFLAAKAVVSDCMKELENQGLTYDPEIMVGAMIETPSAAICAEQLAKVCDFFSLGTNDLVQYTLAVDRNNDRVAPYYIQYHPAVLQMIRQTISAAKQAGIPVSICGEMASELMFVPLLVGMGIDELSINPAKTAEVKMVIRNCDAHLFDLIGSFNFNTDVKSIETLLKKTLKPYYTIQS